MIGARDGSTIGVGGTGSGWSGVGSERGVAKIGGENLGGVGGASTDSHVS